MKYHPGSGKLPNRQPSSLPASLGRFEDDSPLSSSSSSVMPIFFARKPSIFVVDFWLRATVLSSFATSSPCLVTSLGSASTLLSKRSFVSSIVNILRSYSASNFSKRCSVSAPPDLGGNGGKIALPFAPYPVGIGRCHAPLAASSVRFTNGLRLRTARGRKTPSSFASAASFSVVLFGAAGGGMATSPPLPAEVSPSTPPSDSSSASFSEGGAVAKATTPPVFRSGPLAASALAAQLACLLPAFLNFPSNLTISNGSEEAPKEMIVFFGAPIAPTR